jgi:Asp-tRNA(Asn)/Glu-tRNA(Gln) amidotransferase A subunit family amidase
MYDLASVRLPRLTGRALSLFAGALDSPASRSLLLARLLRDAGVEAFRRKTIDDPPTFAPIASDKSAAGRAPIPPLDEIFDEHAPSTFASIRSFRDAYRSRRIGPREVIGKIFTAMDASAAGARPLGAFIACDREDVRAQARASEERWSKGIPIGPLDGVPIGIKDELDQKPYPTSVGTSFLGAVPAKSDATAVARLRALGAVLIGKLNMNEIGINPNGGNMTHGLVRNPYHLDRDPGGSSSGSAAAVAAGFCPVAIGADGGGSIRIPAALCGVVGLKATFGRISEHGAAPLCWTVAHVGPIGATVEDVAIAYAAIAGPDETDPFSLYQPAPSLEGWHDSDLSGLKVGVFRPWFEHASLEVVRAADAALLSLSSMGVERREVQIPELDSMRVAHAVTILSEMAASMSAHLERGAKLTLPTRINVSLGKGFIAQDYVHAQRMRTRAIAAFARAFESVDLIATPATAITAPEIPVTSAKEGWSDLTTVTEVMRFMFPSNLTGHPAITLPVGYDSLGLPIGLQLIGKPWAEHLLLRVARALEVRVERRRPPLYHALLE